MHCTRYFLGGGSSTLLTCATGAALAVASTLYDRTQESSAAAASAARRQERLRAQANKPQQEQNEALAASEAVACREWIAAQRAEGRLSCAVTASLIARCRGACAIRRLKRWVASVSSGASPSVFAVSGTAGASKHMATFFDTPSAPEALWLAALSLFVLGAFDALVDLEVVRRTSGASTSSSTTTPLTSGAAPVPVAAVAAVSEGALAGHHHVGNSSSSHAWTDRDPAFGFFGYDSSCSTDDMPVLDARDVSAFAVLALGLSTAVFIKRGSTIASHLAQQSQHSASRMVGMQVPAVGTNPAGQWQRTARVAAAVWTSSRTAPRQDQPAGPLQHG